VQLTVPHAPGVASVPRRAAAGAIDMLVAGGGLGGVAGAIGLAVAKWHGDEQPGWLKHPENEPWAWRAIIGALRSLQLTERNWRSPGMRAVGIRRVDASTHGPVSIRSAFVGLLLQTGSERIGRTLGQPGTERARARQLAANDEIERMRASRPDEDPKQLIIDSAAIRQRHGASTCTWMLPRMLLRLAVEQLPALWSRRRQTLTERLAGTVVIRER
jgi:RDD family